MAEEKSAKGNNTVWIIVSVVLLLAVLTLGYMLYSEKFKADVVGNETNQSAVKIATISDAKLSALVVDTMAEDVNDNVDLSQEDLSLSL